MRGFLKKLGVCMNENGIPQTVSSMDNKLGIMCAFGLYFYINSTCVYTAEYLRTI